MTTFTDRRRVRDLLDRLALGSIYLGPVELTTTVHGSGWSRWQIGGGWWETRTPSRDFIGEGYWGGFQFRPFRVRAITVNITGRLAFDIANAIGGLLLRRAERVSRT